MNAVTAAPVVSRPRRLRRAPAALLFRSAAVHIYGIANEIPPEVAAERLCAHDASLQGFLRVQKAAVEPALTSVPEWAGNLARETWAEFLGLLAPVSVYAQLATLGLSGTFSGGKVRFPARNATSALAGDFIGEHKPIPVKRGSVLAPSLPPRKVGVITTYSRELSQGSVASMEAFFRAALVEDTAPVIDARLLDSNAATAIRPVGLLNGVTLTPSVDIETDLRAALSPILTAGGGRRLVWLLNPLQAMSLCLATNGAGMFLFPNADEHLPLGSVIVSPNVPAGTMILVDAAEFATAADLAPSFVVSSEALLHMEDTAPEPINAGTMATPVISLFQQDALAIRMIQQMNWTMRRPGTVSGISGIAW